MKPEENVKEEEEEKFISHVIKIMINFQDDFKQLSNLG